MLLFKWRVFLLMNLSLILTNLSSIREVPILPGKARSSSDGSSDDAVLFLPACFNSCCFTWDRYSSFCISFWQRKHFSILSSSLASLMPLLFLGILVKDQKGKSNAGKLVQNKANLSLISFYISKSILGKLARKWNHCLSLSKMSLPQRKFEKNTEGNLFPTPYPPLPLMNN